MGPQGPAGTAQGPVGPVGPAGPPGPQGPPGTGAGGGIADAPSDGTTYARKSAAWVHLTHSDITDWTATLAPYALLASPTFTGTPSLPTGTTGVTQTTGTSNTTLATTAFVAAAVTAGTAGVSSFNTRTGAVTLTSADVTTALTFTPYNATNPAGFQTAAQVTASLAPYAPLASPTFTGAPNLPTGTVGVTQTAATNNTTLATTAYVKSQNYLIANQTVTLSGDIAGSGATAITTTLATVNANVGTFQGLTVNAKGLVTAAVNQSYAPLASPTFTGAPSLPTGTTGVTQTAGNSSTALATTAFVATSFLPLSGGTLTGGLVVQAPVDLKVQTVTQSGANLAINRSLGENCTLSVTASITAVTVSNWPASGVTGKVRLVIVNGGAYTITGWPTGTKWPGGTAPTITASGTDIILLMTDNGGTTIYGSVVGQGYA